MGVQGNKGQTLAAFASSALSWPGPVQRGMQPVSVFALCLAFLCALWRPAR